VDMSVCILYLMNMSVWHGVWICPEHAGVVGDRDLTRGHGTAPQTATSD